MEYETVMLIAGIVSTIWFCILHVEIFYPEIFDK